MKKITMFITALLMTLSLCAASEEVTLKTPTGTLYGTLVTPDNAAGSVPLAIIIAGSGPTDRNCNNPRMANNAYLMLADSLAAHGIASLRYDKQGIAASAAAGKDEKDITLQDFIDDAKGWVNAYAADKRFSKVILAGHSEGALIAFAAAQFNPKIAAVISIAGAGRPMDEILKEQLAAQLPADLMQQANRVIDLLKSGKTTEDYPEVLAVLFRPSVQPFLISSMRYSPCVLATKVMAPILVVQGTTDIQVKTEDADLLAQATPMAQKAIIKDMNHVLKTCTTTDRMEQAGVYDNPSLPLAPKFVEAVVEFIKGLE